MKKKSFNKQNNNFALCTLFCTFLCRLCTTRTQKFLISGNPPDDEILCRFLNLHLVPCNSNSGGFVYGTFDKGIMAMKAERKQMYFLSDVLVPVASLDLKVAFACHLRLLIGCVTGKITSE